MLKHSLKAPPSKYPNKDQPSQMDAHHLYTYQSRESSHSTTTSGAVTPISSSSSSHSAFFYGTLMSPRVLHRVCHGPHLPYSTTRNLNPALTVKPALLTGFRRHRVRRADYPAIVPDAEGTVRGTLVEGLNEGDMWRLDIFEGDDYERRRVTVRPIEKDGERIPPSELGTDVECETYVWIASRRELEDREWDFDEFVREKIGRWIGSGGEAEGEYNGIIVFETRPSILGPSRDFVGRVEC